MKESGRTAENGKAAKPPGDHGAVTVMGRVRRLLRRGTPRSRGFILVLVVGALSVLTVLGLSYTEQSRADLLGASNGRDLLAADGLAETGFQMGLRILAEDRAVWSASNPGWKLNEDGVGHTSRWGYNTNYDLPVGADQDTAAATPSGIQPAAVAAAQAGMGTAFNHRNGLAKNFLESWQTMIWNEEPFNNNFGYAYSFKFDPGPAIAAAPPKAAYKPSKTYYNERRPADERIMLDTWAFQPLARVKRFRVQTGLSYGVVQISISPRDGAINVNDVFDPGTTHERWGFHDWSTFNGSINTDPLASPDRRTMDYILGRRPEYAAQHAEYVSYDSGLTPARIPGSPDPVNQQNTTAGGYVPNWVYDKYYQHVANEPAGSVFVDNGVYDFRGIAEPNGRTYVAPVGPNGGWPTDDPQQPISPSSSCYGRLTQINSNEPLIFYNANYITFYRYNFEAPRYPCYVAMAGPSMRYDGGYNSGAGKWLTQSGTGNYWDTAWWPTGRGWRVPGWTGNDIVTGSTQPTAPQYTAGSNWAPDCLFQGMGFDLINPARGGVGAASTAGSPMVTQNDAGNLVYNGAGMYGHPVPHSFQHHFIAAVQNGKFWTDLQANWFLGGSPGYTNKLGRWPDEPAVDQWAYLGSSYDSMGIGTTWMPPTSHVWLPGMFSGTGAIDPYEVTCGLLTSPRNMPPAKPAATYAHPLNKWGDDFGAGAPHFAFGNQRNMIRAFGIQENWGPPGSGNPDNRMFDAININVAPYEVVYGLLTPEKIPSMMHRTVVAPHLHWKARYFDGAYDMMETYARYTPTGDPTKADAHFAPASYPDAPYMPLNSVATPMDGLPPAALTSPAPKCVPNPINLGAPGTLMPYRFGSVDYKGNFQEFMVNSAIAYPEAKTDNHYAKHPSIADSYCVMGPAPYYLSIHRQYEPIVKSPYAEWQTAAYTSWYPTGTKTPNACYTDLTDANWLGKKGYTTNVGMILNKMDFRTPEPSTYYMLFASMKALTDPPKPDVPGDYEMALYKSGTGEPADDVFVDSHYDLSLAPNTTNAVDVLAASTMMCRPSTVTDWVDWFSQRRCAIDDTFRDTFKPWAPIQNGIPSNTFGVAPYQYPDGRNFSAADCIDGNIVAGLSGLANAHAHAVSNPVPKIHKLYGIPNPDFMLQYPGASSNYYWGDTYRRYFPVNGNPPSFKAAVAGVAADPGPPAVPAIPPIEAGIGKKAQLKDAEVADLTGQKYSQAPAPYLKMVDDMENQRLPFIQPQIPVPKGDWPFLKAPFVPGISKDDAWRITRIGRKYQEIIADEIMDYQVNPWWPNPCVQFSEMAVPLDLNFYPGDARFWPWVNFTAWGLPGYDGNTTGVNYQNDFPKKTANSLVWLSFYKNRFQGNIGEQVPDYYAYFNRFWIRPSHYYTRNTPFPFNGAGGRFGDTRVGNGYGPANLVEARGKYPQTYQYWGVFFNNTQKLDTFWVDNIRDFPENTLEDQLGGEFRYLTTAAKPMFETPPTTAGGAYPFPAAQMSAAPGRNHPFKHWADFVAMLGHLVYRSPLTVLHPSQAWDGRVVDATTSRSDRVKMGIRDRIIGVDAWEVCHGLYADPRNQGQFFDGSQIAAAKGSPAMADALQGYYGYDAGSDTLKAGMGGRNASEAIVAIDGFWPISGNLGVFHDPSGKAAAAGGKPEDLLYPPRPGGAFVDNSGDPGHDPDYEWHRRIDEWRGCDASGLRVEQQYISERAANDILVNLSNGQIGPIDFDGDGHITMTRQQELAEPQYWPLFPYNKAGGVSNVEYIDPTIKNLSFLSTSKTEYGVRINSSSCWKQANKNEHITNCVTLPIKFRSNTFRITVAVELTDAKYRNTAAVHKYSRVYSRVIGAPNGNSKVHGPYTGEFILHGNRAIDGVDPEGSWLGTDFGSE